MVEKEIWKTIDYPPNHAVSNYGEVKNLVSGSIRKPQINNRSGYYHIGFYMNGEHKHIYVHKLVAEAFLGERPPGYQINHIDGNKLNNCVDNLEYCTKSDNIRHAYKSGLNKQTISIKINETGEIFDTIEDCARHINGDSELIRQCLHPDYNRNKHKGYTFTPLNGYATGRKSLKIKISETGEIFDSARQCERAIDGRHCNITNAAKTGRAYKDLHFEILKSDDKPKSKPFLYDFQMDAVHRMRNGCILCGGVGSGKSRTSLFYYFKENGGWIDEYGFKQMKPKPQDLIIITTAQKRDLGEWEQELHHFRMSTDPKKNPFYSHKIVIDSWNNIKKYQDITDAFFVFDEDRLTGKGAWVKAFLKIAKHNNWIVLSATPADVWTDFVPIFVANGFFKNRTEFNNKHVKFSRFAKYPKIEGYYNEEILCKYRDMILVDMDFERKTVRHHEDIFCNYDIRQYKDTMRNRWDYYKNEPITQAAGLCYILRKIVNSDESRQVALLELLEQHPKAIIFYSYDYELEILKSISYMEGTEIAEYNGHRHDPLPTSGRWVYLVNYTSGNAGWNCTTTNCIIFYSQNYSYKILEQSQGRIDRLNTPYKDLYYYHLRSRSGIDLAISKALREKRDFNERKFTKWD